MDAWEQRRQELMTGDDPAARWLRILSAPEAGEHQDQADVSPVVHADMPMAEYAQLRGFLGLDQRGIDRGQVQQHGYRGAELVQQAPGADYVRAAAVIGHPMGQDARAEYGQRQRQAAEAINGFRSGR